MAALTHLTGTPRTEFGKGAARRLRRNGQIPVVVYGNDQEPVHVSVDILEFQAILRNEGVNAVLELVIEGEKNLVMIKAVDQNVLTLNIDHADLLNVKRGEQVEVEVPVVFTGEAAPEALVTQEADVITLLADVLDIPEEISIDVEGAEIGTQIFAGDIKMPSNASLVTDPEQLVINVIEPVVEELPEPGEEEEAVEEALEEAGEPEATEAPNSDES